MRKSLVGGVCLSVMFACVSYVYAANAMIAECGFNSTYYSHDANIYGQGATEPGWGGNTWSSWKDNGWIVSTGTVLLAGAVEARAGEGVLYALHPFYGEQKLWALDIDTGMGTEIGPTGVETLIGLASDSSGRVFAVDADEGTTRHLYELDTSTGQANPIFDLGATGIFFEGGFAIDPTTGLAYVMEDGTLHTVDLSTGELNTIGPMTLGGSIALGNLDGLAFRGDTLYGYLAGSAHDPTRHLSGHLLIIDKNTVAITDVGDVGLKLTGGVAGLAYNPISDIFYLSGQNGPYVNPPPVGLFAVDPTSAEPTLIGVHGLGAVSGLTFVVPEPSTFVLLFMGAIGVAVFTRLRGRRSLLLGLAAAFLLAGVGQAMAMPPISTYAQAVLDDNPIGYWRLGEQSGPKAFDLSGNDLNGTYAGNVALNQPGAILTDTDASALFDGSTAYVDVAADDRLNKLTNDFTIEAWVRKHEGAIDGMIVSNKGSFFSGYGFCIDANPSQIHFVTFGKLDYVAPFSFPDVQWTYIAVVFDSSNDAHFYVNGEFEKTVEGASPAATTSKPLYIGKAPYYNSSGTYGYFTGGLDEVAIYGRSLAAAEIREHYLAAVPEPSALVLLGMGAVGVEFFARRKRTSKGNNE